MLVLITGGSGSGKSAYAEERICGLARTNKYYLACMQVYGEEGLKKVQRHREMRAGKGFVSLEQHTDIADALRKMEDPEQATVLVECMSNLTANEMFREEGIVDRDTVEEKILADMKRLIAGTANQVIVTNNVFDDGITYEETTRQYMRTLGRINARLAALANEVVEVVVGIPLILKKEK